MTIQLTPAHEQIVKARIQTGQYQSAEEVLARALLLLEEEETSEAEWLENVRPKIDAAYANPESPIELSEALDQIRQRLHTRE